MPGVRMGDPQKLIKARDNPKHSALGTRRAIGGSRMLNEQNAAPYSTGIQTSLGPRLSCPAHQISSSAAHAAWTERASACSIENCAKPKSRKMTRRDTMNAVNVPLKNSKKFAQVEARARRINRSRLAPPGSEPLRGEAGTNFSKFRSGEGATDFLRVSIQRCMI